MEHEVSGCIDCPLCKIDFGLNYYCAHPENEEYAFVIELDKDEELITPNNCPLNKYPLMIKKKNWQVFENFWSKNN